MKRKLLAVPLLIVGLAAGGVGGVMVSQVFAAGANNSQANNWGSGNFGGMMGQYAGGSGATTNGWGTMMGQYAHGWAGAMGSYMSGLFNNVPRLSAATAAQDVKASLSQQDVVMDKANNSITYSTGNVKIVALAGPIGADDKFVINGLVNPTLHIQKGAKVSFELINEDTGMPHGVEITSAQPPYGYMSMMQGGIYPGAFIHPIAAADKHGDPVLTATFTANQTGTFYYICEYPGHAAKGMYGQIVVS